MKLLPKETANAARTKSIQSQGHLWRLSPPPCSSVAPPPRSLLLVEGTEALNRRYLNASTIQGTSDDEGSKELGIENPTVTPPEYLQDVPEVSVQQDYTQRNARGSNPQIYLSHNQVLHPRFPNCPLGNPTIAEHFAKNNVVIGVNELARGTQTRQGLISARSRRGESDRLVRFRVASG